MTQANEQWLVKPRGSNRVLFAGPEDAARAYVENNFPRMHVEPGANDYTTPEADVTLYSPQGSESTFNGAWSDADSEPAAAPVEPAAEPAGTVQPSGEAAHNDTGGV